MSADKTPPLRSVRPGEHVPPPPGDLGETGHNFWERIAVDFALEPTDLELLRLACETLDHIAECSEQLRLAGHFIADRFGQLRAHPAVAAKAQHASTFARLCRELQLTTAEQPLERRRARIMRRRGELGG